MKRPAGVHGKDASRRVESGDDRVPRRSLLGMQPRDRVHRYKARCGRCGARCWLGERQRGLLAESEGDAQVVCLSCLKLAVLMGEPTGLVHLGNPALSDGDKWKAGRVLMLVPVERN